jgi:hypothetical protein
MPAIHSQAKPAEGGHVLIPQLWEWAVLRTARNHPVGVSKTEHGAMEALSKALIEAGQPGQGQITQVTLIRPVQAEPTYLRQPPERTATYDGKVIRWR